VVRSISRSLVHALAQSVDRVGGGDPGSAGAGQAVEGGIGITCAFPADGIAIAVISIVGASGAGDRQ